MQHTTQQMDLNSVLCKNPTSTFFIRVQGESMQCAHIQNNDILIVDKSLKPRSNSIVVAIIGGNFTVRKLKKSGSDLFLMPENPSFTSIKITESMNFKIWGVVTHTIHSCI